MLREHFRCVAPIIEYSKREFYNHELKPLRIPTSQERIDPPLVDVFIEDGYRNGNLNRPEAQFIVREIEKLVADPAMAKRTIGVVSLLADDQAAHIFERLTHDIGPEMMERHRIACGDARTFQGKERDIMFLSLVTANNERTIPLTTAMFAQRFNVAASRARDRMYLVRSVELNDLSPADTFRRSLLTHFTAPFLQDEEEVVDLRQRCESEFEREVFDELTQRGFRVLPQVRASHYRIDLVVEGNGNARLAIECDGDKFHGPDKWAEDQHRQRVLERAGWVFWRCFASTYVRRKKVVLDDLLKTLAARGIEPIAAEGAPRSVHTELRTWRTLQAVPENEDSDSPDEVPPETGRSEINSSTSSRVEPGSSATAPKGTPHVGPAINGYVRRTTSRPSMPTHHMEALDFLSTNDCPGGTQKTIDPETRFTDQVLDDFCRAHRLRTKDKRPVGGALWVEHLDSRGAIATQLKAWGFKLAPAKGYWRK